MNEYKSTRDRHEHRGESNHDKQALIELTQKEQDHRHQLQEKQQKANNISYIFGMVFGFLYNIALLYFAYYLVEAGHKGFAVKVILINAIVILGSFGLLSFSRKLSFNKKPHHKHNSNSSSDRRRFRPKN